MGETPVCCFFTYLRAHWLILLCALTRDRTHNLGTSGCCCNLSCPARAWFLSFVFQSLHRTYVPSDQGDMVFVQHPGSVFHKKHLFTEL